MLPDRAGESLVAMGHPTRVVAIQTARRAARSGALWGLVFGIYVVASSIGFATAYPTAAPRTRLAVSLGGNPGIAALLGPARAIDTVAGFTAWRTMAVLTVVGAIWALSSPPDLLRGEEDAGRWELYLSGQTTRARAAAQALLGLGTGDRGAVGGYAVFDPGGRIIGQGSFPDRRIAVLRHCLIAGAAMFAAVGALVSQLAANRRQANGVGAGVIGAALPDPDGRRLDPGLGVAALGQRHWAGPRICAPCVAPESARIRSHRSAEPGAAAAAVGVAAPTGPGGQHPAPPGRAAAPYRPPRPARPDWPSDWPARWPSVGRPGWR